MKTQIKGDIIIVDVVSTTIENDIIVTRARKAKSNKGIVIAIGDKVSLDVKVGDTVFFNPVYLMPWFENKRAIQSNFIKGKIENGKRS